MRLGNGKRERAAPGGAERGSPAVGRSPLSAASFPEPGSLANRVPGYAWRAIGPGAAM